MNESTRRQKAASASSASSWIADATSVLCASPSAGAIGSASEPGRGRSVRAGADWACCDASTSGTSTKIGVGDVADAGAAVGVPWAGWAAASVCPALLC